MRRSEFEVTDKKEIESFLGECEYGVLSLISGDNPYGIAVNFAYEDGKFYFHGALQGRKAEAIGEDTKCSFTVVKPYAYIPSYFSDTRSACPATQFFVSVIAGGMVTRIDDLVQKAFGLTALMEKMQPEGGYEPIDAANPIYTKMMSKTGVYVIEPDFITLKVKAGQNLPKVRHDAIMEQIKGRNSAIDHETISLIKHTQIKEL
ncbi:pyridoxamine 5'-phosphate oxidase family protein [Sulfurimonas sp.]|uniref:pyridoxamine 5'-phosphate oxidase family protein n=1 Tax=Sulfurimonas sp. TaxID=2022749 RepID=UPI0026213BDC|nr:pyridoxamine 5'-phosphate oxidase family protein [Sulfurimonas sp.]MDD5156765.1 pyridoxamine 5'-phosphate oxidase family protein [Sulfurimonas sp.]